MSFTVQNGDVLEVVISARMNSQTLLNVLHYQYTESTPQIDGKAEIDAVLDQFTVEDGMLGAWADAMSNACTIESISGQIIKPVRFPYVRRSVGLVGDLVGQPLPQNVSASITKQSTIAGRGKSGRLQAFPADVGSVANGLITAGARTKYTALANAVGGKLDNAGGITAWLPIIFDRDAGGTQARVEGTVVQSTVRVLSRRTVGRGV